MVAQTLASAAAKVLVALRVDQIQVFAAAQPTYYARIRAGIQAPRIIFSSRQDAGIFPIALFFWRPFPVGSRVLGVRSNVFFQLPPFRVWCSLVLRDRVQLRYYI